MDGNVIININQRYCRQCWRLNYCFCYEWLWYGSFFIAGRECKYMYPARAAWCYLREYHRCNWNEPNLFNRTGKRSNFLRLDVTFRMDRVVNLYVYKCNCWKCRRK